jgi:hypothetical protein
MLEITMRDSGGEDATDLALRFHIGSKLWRVIVPLLLIVHPKFFQVKVPLDFAPHFVVDLSALTQFQYRRALSTKHRASDQVMLEDFLVWLCVTC